MINSRNLLNKLKHIKIAIVFMLFVSISYAQQLPIFTQYLFNKYVFNPAFTGTEDNFSATANYRYQWQGVTDAPRTYVLSVHGPHKYKSFGLGGALYTDVTGPVSKTGMYLSYAYNFKATRYTKISFGLSGGMMQYRVDGTKITLAEPGDITLANSLMAKIVPDFGFGGVWYNDDFYLGLSVPQFIQTKLDFTDDNQQTLSQIKSHLYLNGGYTFTLNNDFSIEPSTMIRISSGVIPQCDFATKLIFQTNYYLGAMVRTQDALALITGYMTPNGKFNFGYAYDVTIGNLGAYSNGSHELMIKAAFGDIKQKRPTRARKGKRRMSKMERLERKLKNIENRDKDNQSGENSGGENNETKDGGMDYYDDTKKDQTEETNTQESDDEKSIEQRIEEVEREDRELRAKVRELRDDAESQGYGSPNDSNYPRRQEYIEALDKIKDVYRKKKELDGMLD